MPQCPLSWRTLLHLLLLAVAWHSTSARPLDEDGLEKPDKRPDASVEAADAYAILKGNVTSSYFTNEGMDIFMHRMADECSHMMSLFSIGRSAAGKDILALDISYTSGLRDGKPTFHYIGNMHGNEPSGRQLLLQLAAHLCENSVSEGDVTVQRLLSSVHLIVVPTANPDGYAANQRENSKRVDLNRDFPTRSSSNQTHLAAKGTEQAETKVVMKLMSSFNFAAGVNLHEGALVANYPWDNIPEKPRSTEYASAWDDATFRMLASSYAQLHTRMYTQATSKFQPTRLDDDFVGGITNGNAWYPVFGGMQDYIYLEGHCMELTLELWESKQPAASLLGELWAENRASLLQLPLRALLGGFTGSVRRVGSGGAAGSPVAEAVVTLVGSPVTTPVEAAGGQFSRPLAAGVHNITVSAPGYQDFSTQVTVPDDYSGTNLEVQLVPSDPGTPAPPAQGAPPYPYSLLVGRLTASEVVLPEVLPPTPQIQPVQETSEPAAVLASVSSTPPTLPSVRTLPSTKAESQEEVVLLTKPLPQAVEHSLAWYTVRTVLVIVGPLGVLYELMRRRSRSRARASL